MKHYFNADSFGANLPDTWEHDTMYLNAIATLKGITTIEELADLWDKYCNAELQDEYIAKGYTRETIEKVINAGFYVSDTTHYRLERYYAYGILTVVCIPKAYEGTTMMYDEDNWKLVYVSRY